MSSKVLFGLAVALGFAAVSSAFAATGDASTGAVTPSVDASTGVYLSSLDVNGDVKVVAATSTGVSLTWDAVPAATEYVVYYDVKSPDVNDPNATYAFSTEPFKTNSATVSGLKPSTKYYMMVIALDANGHESLQPSKEISATTAGVASFGLSDGAVTVTSTKTLTLAFNQKLDAAKPVSVTVTSNLDKSDLQAAAVVSSADVTKAEVTLGVELTKDSSYTVVVKLATSAEGQNVQAGANAAQEFTFTNVAAPVLNAAPVAAVAAPAPIAAVPDAAALAVEPDVVTAPAVTAAPAAAPVKNQITSDMTVVQNGPAENIVVAMALLLGAAVFVLRRRKGA